MTGKDLVKKLKRATGPLYVTMLAQHDAPYIQAVKADVIHWASRYMDEEIGMRLTEKDGANYLDVVH